jgi:hypothetical protein
MKMFSLSLVALIGLLCATASADPVRDAFSGAGDSATITARGDGIPCFASTDGIGAAEKAADAKDSYGPAEALQGAVRLKAGDRVLLIDSATPSFGEMDLRFRILSGSNAGVACWISSDYDRSIVKNIKH